MAKEKLEVSVTMKLLVVKGMFEESGLEGKRVVLLLNGYQDALLKLRLTKENFRYLLREMNPANHHREEFTEADGQELLRWINRKFLKVRVQKFAPTGRTTVELVEFVKEH